jgi:alpha-glucosidase
MHNVTAAALVLLCGSPVEATLPIACRSPDGTLAIEFRLRKDGTTDGVPHYRVRAGGSDVVGWSRLGVDLAGGELLGGPCAVTGVETRSVRDEYTQFPGKRRHVVGQATEATVQLREKEKPHRRWEVVLRAYDDGVAFRYRFPAQKGWTELAIAGERTQFAFPEGTRAYALPLNGFTTSYEKRYQRRRVAKLPADWLLGLPLLLQRPGRGWAAITEADVDEYAGLYLAPTAPGATLSARLSPLPEQPKLAVKARLPHASPWRVVMVADRAGRLIESDLVLNLSKPCVLRDVSWIKPGKTTFPWWNGYVLDGVTFKPGQNTATHKHYLDFCAANGIAYHSLDGLDNIAWYGGTIVPYKGADPTTALPDIDLPELLRYARSKGVRLRLWMHWEAAQRHMAKAFPLYKEWGVEGVMLDFMDRDDQEMYRFLRKAVRLAAENRLTVTLHGCPKPTGLERTYPNLLTHEAVLNLEYNKWDRLGCPPEHQVTVAFTRMLAGPLDFHQGSFRTVAPEAFKPRDKAPLVMGTPCRTLASYVVYQNHLSMVADSPSAYAGHPALPVLVNIPTAWDDTRVVAESVGEYVVIARRQGDVWHLGAMTDRKARTLKVPLKFLGPGRYSAELWVDDARAKHGLSRRKAAVTAAEELTLDLTAAGGAYVRFTRAKGRNKKLTGADTGLENCQQEKGTFKINKVERVAELTGAAVRPFEVYYVGNQERGFSRPLQLA